jgi:hypothetical protein
VIAKNVLREKKLIVMAINNKIRSVCMPEILTRVTQLERENLEAHVDLCAMRYEQLDTRLTDLEKKVDQIHTDILSGQKSLIKVLVGTAGTVLTGIFSIAVPLLLK